MDVASFLVIANTAVAFQRVGLHVATGRPIGQGSRRRRLQRLPPSAGFGARCTQCDAFVTCLHLSFRSGKFLSVVYRILYPLALLVFTTTPLHAQSTVGYVQPDSTRPLTAYQLPDWSYRVLTLTADSRANGFTRTRANGDSDRSTFHAFVGTAPRFRALRESEARTADLFVRPQLRYNYRTSETDRVDGTTQRETRKHFRTSTTARGALREYIRPDRFLLADVSGRLDYTRTDLDADESPSPTTPSDTETLHYVESRFGIGLGRVRNVTPVIRALRLDARLQALGRDARLTDEEVQDVAHQFARTPGYGAVYDRPDKYFWDDLFEQLDGRLSPLSPFETLYLTDVLQERIGQRFEGADVAAGGLVRTGMINLSAFNPGPSSNASSEVELGAFASGRWYKNLSLNHQLELNADLAATTVVTTADVAALRSTVGGAWLWSVADRFLLDTRLAADFITFDEPSTLPPHPYTNQQHYTATTNLFIFVENSVALQVGGHADWQRNESSDWFNWNATLGLSYYLDRALR